MYRAMNQIIEYKEKRGGGRHTTIGSQKLTQEFDIISSLCCWPDPVAERPRCGNAAQSWASSMLADFWGMRHTSTALAYTSTERLKRVYTSPGSLLKICYFT